MKDCKTTKLGLVGEKKKDQSGSMLLGHKSFTPQLGFISATQRQPDELSTSPMRWLHSLFSDQFYLV